MRLSLRVRRVFPLAIIATALILPVAPASAADSVDTETPTPTASATAPPTATPPARPTARPSPLPTAEPAATGAPIPTATSAPPTPEKRHRRHHRPTPTLKPTRTPAPVSRKKHRHKHHKKTPTPTPTVTPVLNLNAEDSVAPVTCNGPGRHVAKTPFLIPPYRGWTSIVSYFDHDLPDYVQDGAIVTSTGAAASVDKSHHALDFPAYWDSRLRQYLYYDGHNGYDYNLWYQPVYAAARGKVIFARLEYTYAPDHGYGNMIMIQHPQGYVTLYGHLSKMLVHKGDKVHAGQQIGISGNTGHSSGPHLHFTVFHNCSPTDPYGWTGTGSDPLAAYQGEGSVFLWKREPDVFNPLPDLPGTIPAGGGVRILLLRLPSTRVGTSMFSADLARLAGKDASRLRARGLTVTVDLLRGALVVAGTASPLSFYNLPGVVSITTSDVEEGARADVLSALARAGLATHHRRIAVARSTRWSGYIVRLQGQAILVGRGDRGKEVDLMVRSRGHSQSVHRIHADPKTGAYALDLGAMSAAQVHALARQLSGRGTGGSSVKVRKVVEHAPQRTSGSHATVAVWPFVLAGLIVAIALGGLAPLALRRYHVG